MLLDLIYMYIVFNKLAKKITNQWYLLLRLFLFNKLQLF